MVSYAEKYKDRQPNETIDIINNFFNRYGYKVEVKMQSKSEADTFWCRLNLIDIQTQQIIQCANGKGATEIYALASGYAEMYERFCSLGLIYTNPFILDKYYSLLCGKDCTILPYKDMILNDANAQSFYNSIFTDDASAELYYNLINNQKPYGDIFINLQDNNYKLFNSPMVRKIMGSTGLSAGNTLTESLVQGLSEFYERYAISQIILNSELTYYQLDNSVIQNPTIINIINKIEQNNNKLYIFDLSYSLKVPVVMVLVANLNTQNFLYSFGSFPVFDLALERTLTELYQGLNDLEIPVRCDIPFRSVDLSTEPAIQSFIKSISTRNIVLDNVLLNCKVVSEKNNSYFLNRAAFSNDELLHFCKKINTINNFEIYYKDISLDSQMFATQLYCPNVKIYNNNSYLASSSFVNQSKYFKIILLLYQIINDILHKEHTNLYNLILLLINYMQEYNHTDEIILKVLMQEDWLQISTISNIDFFSLTEIKKILNNEYSSIKKKNILLMIKQFIKSNYSISEIETIFKFFNIDQNIITSCEDNCFLIWKTFFEDIYNIYNNKTIDNYILTIQKKGEKT